jgi:hypothetical protein
MAAQRTFTASGFVRDAATGEVLISAYVYDAASGRSAQTNAYGFYSLQVQGDSAKIQASYPTYAPLLRSIPYASSGVRSDFDMQSLDVTLSEVEVSANRPIQEEVQMSTVSLSMKTIKNLPTTIKNDKQLLYKNLQ